MLFAHRYDAAGDHQLTRRRCAAVRQRHEGARLARRAALAGFRGAAARPIR